MCRGNPTRNIRNNRPVHPLPTKVPTSTTIQRLLVYLAHIYIDQQLKNTTEGIQEHILCEQTLNLPHTVDFKWIAVSYMSLH